jgi:hypothetical protein
MGDDGGITDAPKDKIPIDTYMPGCDVTMKCDPPATNTCVVKFDTALQDVNAMPITTEQLFLCGTNICTKPFMPSPQGKISEWVCGDFVRPAAKYIGGVNYASFTALAMNAPMVSIPPLTLVKLPTMGQDLPGAGGGTITSNMVSLTLAANTKIDFDPTEPMDVDLHRYRAVQVPAGKFPPGAPAAIQVVWGLGPINAHFTPNATLKVPNTEMWPANALVDVYLNSVDGYEMTPPVAYGDWGKLPMTAQVTNDQMWVDLISLPMVGMVGLHKQ